MADPASIRECFDIMEREQEADRADYLRRCAEAFKNRRKPCTCTGSCRGPEGLGEGWACCLTLPASSSGAKK